MSKILPRRITPKDIKNGAKLHVNKEILRSKVFLWKGDITRLEFDAIVNAANSSLLGGGGVDGAIHAAAGRKLLAECRTLEGCDTGDAKITKGYKLSSKHVIHTVGPIGEKQDKLSSCYKKSLDLMKKHKLKSIAFPCISTGIYGYPNESAAHVALGTVKEWLDVNSKQVDAIVFCLFLPTDVEIYKRLVEQYFPVTDGDNASSSVDPQPDAKEVESLKSQQTNDQADKKRDQSLPSQVSSTLTNDMSHMKFSKAGNGDDISCETASKGEIVPDEDSKQNAIKTKMDMGSVAGKRPRTEGESTVDDTRRSQERKMDASQLHASSHRQSKKVHDESKNTSEVTNQQKDNQDMLLLTDESRAEWIAKFESYEKEAIDKVICTDTESWAKDKELGALIRVGGLDISYHNTKANVACVTLVVLSFPDLEVIYEDTELVEINVPYIAGYLAYREASHYKKKVEKVMKTKSAPQVILVDANGILHPRKFGCATNLGVDCDVPTIGVAKSFLVMEEFGIEKDENHKAKIDNMMERGSSFDITTNKDEVLGKALRTTDESKSPIYISVGHRCSLETAVRVTLACSKYRVPDPVRQADQLSRTKLKEEHNNCKSGGGSNKKNKN